MRYIVTLITVCSLVPTGCDDRMQSQATRRASNEAQVAERPAIEEPDSPKETTYSILDSRTVGGVTRSLEIRLNNKVSEETLRAIAIELKSQDSGNYDRTLITYYLPGMSVGAGAWATTHFNPDLKVQILGLSAGDEERLVATPAPANREIVGRWLDERPFVARSITIFREDGKLFIEQMFKDGSSLKEELVEQTSPSGRRFDPKSIPSTNVESQQPDSSANTSRSKTAKTPSKKPEPSETAAGRQFLKSKLAELNSFKNNHKFHQLGFSVRGPFNSWLKSLESKRDAREFSFLESVSVGDLELLGFEYMKTKGQENEYTRWAREQITQAIQGAAKIQDPDAGKHWVVESNGNLQVRNNGGLITTAKKVEWNRVKE